MPQHNDPAGAPYDLMFKALENHDQEANPLPARLTNLLTAFADNDVQRLTVSLADLAQFFAGNIAYFFEQERRDRLEAQRVKDTGTGTQRWIGMFLREERLRRDRRVREIAVALQLSAATVYSIEKGSSSTPNTLRYIVHFYDKMADFGEAFDAWKELRGKE